MSEWRRAPIGDLVKMTSGGTPRKSEPEYWDGDIPWISGASMHSLRAETSGRMVTVAAIGSGTKLAPVGSSLILVRGMSLLEEVRVSHVSRPVAFNQDVKALTPRDGVEPWFLTYLLLANRDRLLGAVHQAGHGTGVLATERLAALEIGLPPLDEQRRIAKVLGAIDDLIDTNERSIEKLAESFDAHAWSTELSTAEVAQLGSKITLQKGVSYKGAFLAETGLPLINLASFSRSGVLAEQGTKYYTGPVPAKKMLRRGDLVVANTDLTQERLLLGRPTLARRVSSSSTHHTFQVGIGDPIDRLWVFALLRHEPRREHLASFATGTTVTALPADAVTGLQVPWPDRNRLEEWHRVSAPLLDAAHGLEQENEQLRRTRDELLPLLMSGAVRVQPEGVAA